MAHEYIKENDTFSISRNGTVPKPTQAEVTAGKVLKADGTWGEGGGGGSSTLAGLTDVDLSSPSDGQILKYDAENDKWINDDESSGTVTDVNVNGESVVDSNGKAQIKSYKEVTQSEYNNLPDSKLSDGILYCIKDVGGADGYPPLIYSDEEREVGVWRDGKPLYKKSLHCTFTEDYYDFTIDSTIQIKMIEGLIYASSGDYDFIHLGYGNIQADKVQAYQYSSTIFRIQNSFYSTRDVGDFTIYYTKTTDTPGSGTWTTQGAIAHHYSTTEQVIGIDENGKPIYEKTIIYNQNIPTGWISLYYEATTKVRDYRARIYTNSTKTDFGINNYFRSTSNYYTTLVTETEGVRIYNNGDARYGAILVIQYTKTTD